MLLLEVLFYLLIPRGFYRQELVQSPYNLANKNKHLEIFRFFAELGLIAQTEKSLLKRSFFLLSCWGIWPLIPLQSPHCSSSYPLLRTAKIEAGRAGTVDGEIGAQVD